MMLETARLRLRRMTADDAEFLCELMNEPEFIANVAARGIRTPADAARWIAEKIEPAYQREGFGFNVIELKQTATAIGICGLVKRESLEDVDIGYAILRAYSGKGYAFEAASAVLDHGRNVLGLLRIVAITSSSNTVSIHLLEKLGLRFERIVQLPEFERPSMLFGCGRAGRLPFGHVWNRHVRRGHYTSGMSNTTAATESPVDHVIVRGKASGFLQEGTAGKYSFRVDEPVSVGGTESAPDPYDYLLAALGSCTSMTIGYYARRNKIPLQDITVRLTHSRIHAEDCETCETRKGMLDRIDLKIELTGPITSEQHSKLMEVAAKCPVHRTLKSEIEIRLQEVREE